MTDIRINAKVECNDGAVGQTTNVIINPVTRKVTHIAIKDKHLPRNDTRLVPFNRVAEVTHERIRLDCSKDEVAAMPPFIEGQLIQESITGQAYSDNAYTSQYVFNNTAYDVVETETRIHAHRVAGGDCHHCHSGRVAGAGGPGCAQPCTDRVLPEQPPPGRRGHARVLARARSPVPGQHFHRRR